MMSSSSASSNINNDDANEKDTTQKLYYHCVTDENKEEKNYIKICRIPDNSNNNNTYDNDKHDTPKQTSTTNPAPTPPAQNNHPLPSSVLQYQRQLRKVQAANRASNTTLVPSQHLHILYQDEYLVVTNKPSGVLCVPGVNQNDCLLGMVFERFGFDHVGEEKEEEGGNCNDKKRRKKRRKRQKKKKERVVTMDNMIVHRLDMDTSGIVVFGRNEVVVKALHEAFRDRKVTKKYEALLCGHLPPNMNHGEINMALQRDHRHPPFMRISTPSSEAEAANAVKDLQHAGWKKIIMKKPKDSVTHFRVMEREMLKVDNDDCEGGGRGKSFPATRVELIPVTGRTHQLRVHCAAIGHPIVADPTYGVWGEASPNGGLLEHDMDRMFPGRASLDLQRDIDSAVRRRTCLMDDDKEDEASIEDTGESESDIMCMCLHARELAFDHPITGEHMVFEAPPSF